MEEFTIDVTPSAPQTKVPATLDELTKHPELYYQGADIVWMLVSSGLVFQMVPAMCLFYSGATSRTASLKLFRLPLITAAMVGFQWYLWGYTLAFTPAVAPEPLPKPSWYGWESRGAALHDSMARPAGAPGPKIPEMVYQFYESMFASFTAALVCGGTIRDDPGNTFPSSNVPVGRFLIFITLWSLLVYNPVARWTWHWAGWSNQLGVMDFAGGTAVHITSGTTVLAFYIFYAFETGQLRFRPFKRKPRDATTLPDPQDPIVPHQESHIIPGNNAQHKTGDTPVSGSRPNSMIIENQEEIPVPTPVPQDDATHDVEAAATHGAAPAVKSLDAPHNVNNIVLGTALLWIGWFGFNGGSALGGNLRAASACASTHVAACAGGTTMLLLFWWSMREKTKATASVTHFCDGCVVALVAITPGAGYVPVWTSGIFGVVSALVVFFFKWVTKTYLYDAPLYVFAIHAGGGLVGMILTGAFADQNVVGLDGYSTIPERSRGTRVGYQLADALAGFSYTFCMTIVILLGLKVVRSVVRWEWSAGFEKPLRSGRERLEAVPLHEWVGGAVPQRQEEPIHDPAAVPEQQPVAPTHQAPGTGP